MESHQFRYGTARRKQFAKPVRCVASLFSRLPEGDPAMLCCRPDGQNPLFSNEPHAGHCRGLKKFAARRLSNSLASALGATAAIGSGCGICENRVLSFRSIQLHRVSALGRKRTWQPPNLG